MKIIIWRLVKALFLKMVKEFRPKVEISKPLPPPPFPPQQVDLCVFHLKSQLSSTSGAHDNRKDTSTDRRNSAGQVTNEVRTTENQIATACNAGCAEQSVPIFPHGVEQMEM